MNKVLKVMTVLAMVIATFCSCNDIETYGEQKEHESSCIRNMINTGDYITGKPVKVISEATFKANGYKTNVDENEYVVFENNGVYMQILEQGCGEKLQSGDSEQILCRFSEYNINDNAHALISNLAQSSPDIMNVMNTSGTFTASFQTGSYMYQVYSSAQVPAGWLIPLTYINIGRPTNDNENIAHVRLIVPHGSGHAMASQMVCAYFYDITYQRGR